MGYRFRCIPIALHYTIVLRSTPSTRGRGVRQEPSCFHQRTYCKHSAHPLPPSSRAVPLPANIRHYAWCEQNQQHEHTVRTPLVLRISHGNNMPHTRNTTFETVRRCTANHSEAQLSLTGRRNETVDLVPYRFLLSVLVQLQGLHMTKANHTRTCPIIHLDVRPQQTRVSATCHTSHKHILHIDYHANSEFSP